MRIKILILQCWTYLQNHLQVLRNSLLVLSLLTLFFCRQISGYFSDYNTNYWFDYFIIIERLSMLFLVLSAYSYLNKKCWIIIELLFFFLAQDIIDRLIYDIKVWSINDTVIIGLITLQYIIKIYDTHRKNKKPNLVDSRYKSN